MSRMFTDEELQEMIIPSTERLKQAVADGRKEDAQKLLHKLTEDYQFAFDSKSSLG